jgi:Flp pilus assembly pilin Flp
MSSCKAPLGPRASRTRALRRDVRGAVTAEYVIVVGTVSLVLTGALLGVGPKLVAGYTHARGVLLQPYP